MYSYSLLVSRKKYIAMEKKSIRTACMLRFFLSLCSLLLYSRIYSRPRGDLIYRRQVFRVYARARACKVHASGVYKVNRKCSLTLALLLPPTSRNFKMARERRRRLFTPLLLLHVGKAYNVHIAHAVDPHTHTYTYT